MNKELKKIIWLSILLSLACILAVIDKYISGLVLPLIPVIGIYISNIKIGLANIIIIYILDHYKFRYSIITVILKSIIIGFIYGSMISFFIGFVGTILSFFVMLFLNKLINIKKKYIYISMIGGITHMIGQIIVIFIYYGLDYTINNVILFSPIILIIGLITGLLIGIIYEMLNPTLNKVIKTEEKE